MSTQFYATIAAQRVDSDELKQCVENTVSKLMAQSTSDNRPGILLGKVQSGKTRAFLGIIALAFDRGYEVAIVLTKGTRSLASQTVNRALSDFKRFIESDEVRVYDIMTLPENLVGYELNQKLILVAKKEADNLERLVRAFRDTYPQLRKRKLLVVDDEADFASLSFQRRDGQTNQGVISQKIELLRDLVTNPAFLQVTATPYSLYLQPEEELERNGVVLFRPKRPAFTEILPIYPGYIGGEFYFEQNSNSDSIAHFTHRDVPVQERDALKKEDGRRLKLEDVLVAKNAAVLRHAILSFMMGAAIRRYQQRINSEPVKKYSFVVHTEHSRESHGWQLRVAEAIYDKLVETAKTNPTALIALLQEVYQDLKTSVELGGLSMPGFQDCVELVRDALESEHLMITTVNSDRDVNQLLDERGQLKLRTPMNLFIGGQILDRGITIDNLIGFYYGRNPRKFQQDTVLQHSRMYGARAAADLRVTRFYTPQHIFQVMLKIHGFDSALREAFESGAHERGVYFIQRDSTERIVPCSPNKLLFSRLTSIRPGKRLLPVGFQTIGKTKGKPILDRLDKRIREVLDNGLDGHCVVDVNTAIELLKLAYDILEFENEEEDDRKGHIAALEHLSKTSLDASAGGKVFLLCASNRDLARMRDTGRFSDAPDTKEQADIVEQQAYNITSLMLLRQNGSEEKGWRGLPFWWPVIVAPRNAVTSVFAAETPASSEDQAEPSSAPLPVQD